ncbi:unnamed protein product [Adineta ricciae]|uniref:Uncharacterized protein n=1 Tax=Adineta ricciae TaxID=249248 RepID=A0A816BQK7_ADIRI|nr:unnamed protein product [Adineta ricciae]CAF1613558.1 unnamed protein product [Adineta ricciae]
MWSDLGFTADAKDSETRLVGWAVYRYCGGVFRPHTKINDKGKTKNHGLISCIKLLEQSYSRKKETTEIAKRNSPFESYFTKSITFSFTISHKQKENFPILVKKVERSRS